MYVWLVTFSLPLHGHVVAYWELGVEQLQSSLAFPLWRELGEMGEHAGNRTVDGGRGRNE